MKLHTNLILALLASGGTQFILALPAHSAVIANWKMLSGTATNSGMDTNSPTIGNGTTNNADNVWLAARLGTVATPASVTLAVGETLTVSGTVVLTGGDDLRREGFRIGVFDAVTEFENGTTTFANGGWLMVPSSNGIFKARIPFVFAGIGVPRGDETVCFETFRFQPKYRSWVSIFHRRVAEVAKERRALHVGR